MTKVDNLSLKEKVLNYLKRGVAFISTAAIIFSASKDSAKAEGNSNIPNPTNIEEQTNTPIPSAGEDVIVANETDISEINEITDIETWYGDKIYTVNEAEKYINWTPQLDSNIATLSAFFHFPYNDKEAFDYWNENGILPGDKIDNLFNDFLARSVFEMPGKIIYSYANSEIDKAIKQGKEITADYLVENGPDFSRLFPKKMRDTYQQDLKLVYSVLIDVKTTKKKDKLRAGTKGFIPLLESIIGVGDPRDINKLIAPAPSIGTRNIIEIKNLLYKKMYSSDDAFDKWKIAIIFSPIIKRITYDYATTNEKVETCFKKDPNTKEWVYTSQPNNIAGGARKIKNDFEYICTIYKIFEKFKEEWIDLLCEHTFAFGTKYRALWINGGMEDFDETLYIIPEENGISK